MDRREFIKTAAVAGLPGMEAARASTEDITEIKRLCNEFDKRREENIIQHIESPVRHLFIYDHLEKCQHAAKGDCIPYLMADTRWPTIGIASMPFNKFWKDAVLKCLDTNEVKLDREDVAFIISHRIITEEKYKEIMNKVNVRIEWKWDSENKKYSPLKVIYLDLCGKDQEAIYVEV